MTFKDHFLTIFMIFLCASMGSNTIPSAIKPLDTTFTTKPYMWQSKRIPTFVAELCHFGISAGDPFVSRTTRVSTGISPRGSTGIFPRPKRIGPTWQGQVGVQASLGRGGGGSRRHVLLESRVGRGTQVPGIGGLRRGAEEEFLHLLGGGLVRVVFQAERWQWFKLFIVMH